MQELTQSKMSQVFRACDNTNGRLCRAGRELYAGGYVNRPFVLSHARKLIFNWWLMHPLYVYVQLAQHLECFKAYTSMNRSPRTFSLPQLYSCRQQTQVVPERCPVYERDGHIFPGGWRLKVVLLNFKMHNF